MDTATTTDPAAGARRPAARKGGAGPDRVAVVLFSLAAFLAVLALLAGQLRASTRPAPRRTQVEIRRIYRTTVIETVPGPGAGASVSQSVSSSGSAYAPAQVPVTRTS